jgi:hypothetical protein
MKFLKSLSAAETQELTKKKNTLVFAIFLVAIQEYP